MCVRVNIYICNTRWIYVYVYMRLICKYMYMFIHTIILHVYLNVSLGEDVFWIETMITYYDQICEI